jgi:hypothetical protein
MLGTTVREWVPVITTQPVFNLVYFLLGSGIACGLVLYLNDFVG